MVRVTAGPPSSPSRNLVNNVIPNGNFEFSPSFTAPTTANAVWVDGTASGSTTNGVYGWGMGPGGQGGSWSAQYDTTLPNSGANSMKMSITAIASQMIIGKCIAATRPGIIYCPVVPIVGISYTYSFFMRTNAISGDSNDGAFATVKTRSGTGATVTSVTSTKVKVTTGWTNYTGTITPATTSVVFDIQLQLMGSSGAGTLIMDAWFDDIQLGQTTPLLRTTAGTRTQAGTRTVA